MEVAFGVAGERDRAGPGADHDPASGAKRGGQRNLGIGGDAERRHGAEQWEERRPERLPCGGATGAGGADQDGAG